jgi:pilus assembly protein FimV
MLADATTVAKPVQKSRAQTRRVQRDIPAGGGYMTQRGDSLWRVANKLRPAGVSTDQMMSALHAANPAAFIKGDPARLKEAVPLTAPTAEQIAAVSDSAPQSSTAESERAVVAKAPAAESGSTAASQQQPAATLQQENAELKAQVTELTTNVTTLNGSLAQSEQRLHQLESQLNELLVQFQQQRATVAALSGTAPDARAAANTVAASGSMISQVNASDLTPPPKAHTPWWVHLMYWLGIGGVALVAIREHFWPRRLATVGAMAGDNLTAAIERTAVPVDNNWRSAGENSRYWHHEEPAASATAIDEIEEIDVGAVVNTAPDLLKPSDDPVDASISAGVFVAFGRFDEAERLLGQAIEQAPDRTDLKLQLLDVYAQADQPEAFAALAAEIERHASGPEVIAELAVLRESYTGKH